VQCIWTASTLIAQKAWLLSAVLWELTVLYKNPVCAFPSPLWHYSCLHETEVCVSHMYHGSMSIVKMKAGVHFLDWLGLSFQIEGRCASCMKQFLTAWRLGVDLKSSFV
jgi:hypothetical protein